MHRIHKFILAWNSTCFGQFVCPPSGVIHCTLNNGACHTGLQTAFKQDRDGTEFHPSPSRKLSTNLYDIYHCWVRSEKTPDYGQRNSPKHAEFHARIKFMKLVHLVGFIIKKFVTMHGHLNVKNQMWLWLLTVWSWTLIRFDSFYLFWKEYFILHAFPVSFVCLPFIWIPWTHIANSDNCEAPC